MDVVISRAQVRVNLVSKIGKFTFFTYNNQVSLMVLELLHGECRVGAAAWGFAKVRESASYEALYA